MSHAPPSIDDILCTSARPRSQLDESEIPTTAEPRGLPVIGNVVGRFYEDPSGRFVLAAEISARRDALDAAMAAGEVIFAEEAIDVGRTVILDHLNGYATVYARLQELLVSAGQALERGDPLGSLGSRSLPLQIRFRSEPRDPLSFLYGHEPEPRRELVREGR